MNANQNVSTGHISRTQCPLLDEQGEMTFRRGLPVHRPVSISSSINLHTRLRETGTRKLKNVVIAIIGKKAVPAISG